MFSSKSLILFGLKFRCLNHLGLVFCMVIENVLILFYFFHVAVQFLSTI